jgi:hypothetical protein
MLGRGRLFLLFLLVPPCSSPFLLVPPRSSLFLVVPSLFLTHSPSLLRSHLPILCTPSLTFPSHTFAFASFATSSASLSRTHTRTHTDSLSLSLFLFLSLRQSPCRSSATKLLQNFDDGIVLLRRHSRFADELSVVKLLNH